MMTCQLNVKVFNHKGNSATDHLWLSDPLENHAFDEEMVSFYADGLSIFLNEEVDAYTIKAARNESALVDLVVNRVTPGFQVGENGTTYYGTDPKSLGRDETSLLASMCCLWHNHHAQEGI
jgi:hypothetical protein